MPYRGPARPRLFRIFGSKLLARYGKSFDPRELYTLPEEPDAPSLQRGVEFWNQRVRFETSSGLHLACLASPGAYDFDALRATWAELIARGRQLGLCSAEVDAWGMALDSPNLTAPERCRYHACMPCPAASALPAPLFPGVMKAGRYAVVLAQPKLQCRVRIAAYSSARQH